MMFKEKSINKFYAFALAALFALTLAGCGGGGGGSAAAPDPDPPAMPTAYEAAVDAIAAAETAEAAQAAVATAVAAGISGAQLQDLNTKVAARVAALAMMARVDAQKMALANAAGNVDTSDLPDADAIAAAKIAIAALKAALAAAADVSDADKAMYQGRVTAAETTVAAAQSTLDHAAQTTALTSAVEALRAIDLADLSTKEKIDAAQAAIEALRMALAAATELSDAEKTAAMTELATADRTVMLAQGRFDTAAQKTALADAVAILAALDLDNLMTEAQIDAAVAAITGVDLALKAATNLTDAEKLDATVDMTVARRKVDRAETVLAGNVGRQRTALTEAGTALADIDLDDLDTAAKIAAADAAVDALKAALEAATHLSDSEKAAYQTQLGAATETVRTAQTGMDRAGRQTAQRTAITNAVTMARNAVAGVSDDSTDSEVAAADAAIAALKAAIEGAEDLPEGDTDVASAKGTLATLEPQLAAAKTSRTAAMAAKQKEADKANAKLGKDMHAALGADDAGTTPLTNIGSPALTSTLSIDATTGAGALPTADGDPDAVALKAGDSAGALGGWSGTDYALTSGTGTSRVTNEARVYTNRGSGRSRPFSQEHALLPAGDDNAGSLLVDTDAEYALVRANAFTHSGTQNHPVPDRSRAVYIRGTYDGAPGEYRCSGTCSSTNDGSGAPSALTGTWHFKPDTGAMVHQPDAEYLYFGWWVRKNNDGVPKAASAFVGVVEPTAGDLDTGGDLTAISGSATYVGNAAGKFAISNPLDGTGSGGHFTADAELKATFGTGATAGVTGTIDNFRLNDGSEDPGWSVALARGALGASGGTITAPTNDPTVWSINGNKALASGTWSGTMYDEMPGNAPDGDGSNIPTTVTGTFYSEFSTIGRMVGAFGANKQQ